MNEIEVVIIADGNTISIGLFRNEDLERNVFPLQI